ncbi:MAG: polysaccharide deacetylase family protein [Chloroflexota bacterium]
MQRTIRLLLLIAMMGFAIIPQATNAQETGITTPDGTLRRIRVPVLMYHYVSELPPDADEFRVNLTVTPDIFRSHLEFFRENDYTPISLKELDDALRHGTELPEKPVVLTFDDGHLDHYTNAFPLLQEFGYTGTFFVITSLLDNDHPDYINWEQAKEMADAGMGIEPHTKNHINLTERNRDTLVYEILGSIESVEAHLGQRPQMFSYPAGRYDDATLAVVAEADIARAVTTEPGSLHTTSNTLLLSRLRVTGNMSPAGLVYIIENF